MALPSLSNELLVALAAIALAGFWMLGAYNRLVELRNAIKDAWARVDEALRQRGGALEPLVAALREPLAAEQRALDALLAAQHQAARAAGAMAARPVDAGHAAAWVAAETTLAAAAARVFALLDHQGDLRHITQLPALVATWREGEARLAFARQLFNDAGTGYNAAIALFPTSLLARLFGFAPAGRL
jgi:LemA protein